MAFKLEIKRNHNKPPLRNMYSVIIHGTENGDRGYMTATYHLEESELHQLHLQISRYLIQGANK